MSGKSEAQNNMEEGIKKPDVSAWGEEELAAGDDSTVPQKCAHQI